MQFKENHTFTDKLECIGNISEFFKRLLVKMQLGLVHSCNEEVPKQQQQQIIHLPTS